MRSYLFSHLLLSTRSSLSGDSLLGSRRKGLSPVEFLAEVRELSRVVCVGGVRTESVDDDLGVIPSGDELSLFGDQEFFEVGG